MCVRERKREDKVCIVCHVYGKGNENSECEEKKKHRREVRGVICVSRCMW